MNHTLLQNEKETTKYAFCFLIFSLSIAQFAHIFKCYTYLGWEWWSGVRDVIVGRIGQCIQ